MTTHFGSLYPLDLPIIVTIEDKGGGQTRPPNTSQHQQQQSGPSMQQSQPHANPMTNIPSGQPHWDGGHQPSNVHNSRDGRRSGNHHNDHSNQTYLASMLSEPSMPTSGNQLDVSSATALNRLLS